MTTLELALTTLAEATATELHRTHDAHGLNALSADAREAGDVGGAARQDVEARLGRPVVSAENHKSLTQPPQRQPSLFEPPNQPPNGSLNESRDETGPEADESDH